MKQKPDPLHHSNYLDRLSLSLKRSVDLVHGLLQSDDSTPRSVSLVIVALDQSSEKIEVRAAMTDDVALDSEELVKALEDHIVKVMQRNQPAN